MTRQLFDMKNLYGLTATQLEARIDSMIMDLKEFGDDEIHAAFTQYRQEENGLPESSHIRKIIMDARKVVRVSTHPAFKPFENKPREPRYDELTDRQKAEVDSIFKQCRSVLRTPIAIQH